MAVSNSYQRVHAAAFSPDGQTIATSFGDGKAHLWDVATGKSRGAAMSHYGVIDAFAFSSDSRSVLTVSVNNTARLWDTATGKRLQRAALSYIGSGSSHHGVGLATALAPDGRTVVLVKEPGPTTDNWNRTVSIRDSVTGDVRGKPMVHPEPVHAVALRPRRQDRAHPDGRRDLADVGRRDRRSPSTLPPWASSRRWRSAPIARPCSPWLKTGSLGSGTPPRVSGWGLRSLMKGE